MADGIMNKDQLLSLTLRQLRQEASKLSVPLYSRKTKAVLVDLILKYQEKSSKKTNISSSQLILEDTSETNTLNNSEDVKTNVVFLEMLERFLPLCFSTIFFNSSLEKSSNFPEITIFSPISKFEETLLI